MALSSHDLEQVLTKVDTTLEDSLKRLDTLLRIPSISTDAAYAGDCLAAAQWLSDELTALGFESSVRPTPGHPMVVAHDKTASGAHVLFYGHYDVQPADPLELWDSPPFEPQIKTDADGNARIVARGASDDKGQLMTFVEACRAFKATTGKLPAQVTILFEGEEESGSPSLAAFLDETKDELTADIALVCDTDMWDKKTPSITTMLRGLVGEEVVITCANRDLHSGMYGNAARNPLQITSEIIASLRNADGSVALEGFYDDVAELPNEVAEMWRGLNFDEAGYLGDIGLTQSAGEQSRSVMEQITSRPTCEINGIWGGYTGEGFKTVIPSKASAKISFRLVSLQDPEKIRAAFRAHVQVRIPADCSVSFAEHGGGRAITVPVTGPHITKARQALTEEWGVETVLSGSGGSIPVVGEFKTRLGMDTLLIGFAQVDNSIHSPNEKYDVASFHGGIRSWVRVLAAL